MDRLVETWEENGEMYTSVVAFGEIKDRLAAYEDTGLTPAEISAMQAENATLKKALEMMYQDNKGYNHDGTGNPEYYMQKARETDGQ